MKIKFSVKTTSICLIFILVFCRLSYWQWNRHLEKEVLHTEVRSRLTLDPLPIQELLASNPETDSLSFRTASATGRFDFEHEVVLRNRRYEKRPGVMVLTPLILEKDSGAEEQSTADDLPHAIMVARGFVPLKYSKKEERKVFQRDPKATVLGVLKAAQERRFMAPVDAPNSKENRLDAWLRPDLKAIQKQIPYSIAPVYLERAATSDPAKLHKALFTSSKGKEELLNLALRAVPEVPVEKDLSLYPAAMVTTTVPPTRHLGYVYEWGFMAFLTALIGLVLQLKRD